MSDKPVTISELKTFIEAVEFAADVDGVWMPSERQWKRIRSMIDRLEESNVSPQLMHIPQPIQQPIPLPQPPVQMFPGGISGMMPAQMMNPNAPMAIGDGNMKVRTPDIDTSNGRTYQSSFA